MKKQILVARTCILVTLAALIVSPSSYARVSLSWGAGSDSNRVLSSAGGESVYESKISLNGADAELNVFSFNLSAPQLAKQLSRLFNDTAFSFKGGTMAFALVRDENKVLRMIILNVSESARTLVIKLEQNSRDYDSSLEPPEKHLIDEIPAFPGSNPLFYAHNKDTDFQLATARVRSNAADIRNFYARMLPQKGWQNPLKESSSLQFYIKGRAVCIVMASKPDKKGSITITLLHKTHGVK